MKVCMFAKLLKVFTLSNFGWSPLNIRPKSLACHEARRQLEQSAILFCLSRVIPVTVFTGCTCIPNNWWLMFRPVSLHQSQWCCADYISGSDKGLNFEPQRCKISMYTAASALWLFRKMASTLNWRRRKVLALHGHVLATLISQTTCCL